ncbi:MAG: hypothetical protein NZM31_08665 [Gemmatales bacterium]|nr:hypothetical protein [Gemmatales bacterium]MDW8387064.1 hypothetical protein [Gemmatales bacterium]
MHLRCPHCKQTVTVPDFLAGQITACPSCSKEFTVPIPPAEPPRTPSQQGFTMGAFFASPQPEPFSAAEHMSGDKPAETKILGLTEPRFSVPLHPEVIRWVVPVTQVLMFVFLFFPWLSSPVGEPFNFAQSGFAAAFGLAGSSTVQAPAPAPWLILLFIVLLLGVLASVALIVERFVLPVLGKQVPPLVAAIVDKRSFILGGLAVLAFLFLTLQLVLGLPAESLDFSAAAPASFAESKELFGQLMYSLIRRTVWLRVTFTLSLVGLLGALADFWLERRIGLPPPKFTVEW